MGDAQVSDPADTGHGVQRRFAEKECAVRSGEVKTYKTYNRLAASLPPTRIL